MADSKISGLPAVAAFAGTQEFPVNDSGTSRKISGTQLTAAVGQGTLAGGYAQVTAAQSGITTVTDLTGLTVTVTPGTGRRLRITLALLVTGTVAANQVVAAIQEGATQLNQANTDITNAGRSYPLMVQAIITPTAAAHTYKGTLLLGIGTGSVGTTAGATFPGFILVEDIGT